ncbi:hypothetical protein PAPYR_9246 [Paratrimastix pyriformis]|uniref:Uncharacterized protein n=1 Tax=Paratrimastix pyriformis TaxID=342808 RepID=A0ABQ8UEF4_9EUKA|nr:hypothetical protein PAPYR_9246 [Paratrimastix pyriformis]
MPQTRRALARKDSHHVPALNLPDLPQALYKLVVLHLFDDDEDEPRETIRCLMLINRKIHQMTSEIISIETMNYAAIVQATNPFASASPDQTRGKEALMQSRLEVLRTEGLINQAASHAFLAGLPKTTDAFIRQTVESVSGVSDTEHRLAQARAELAKVPAEDKVRLRIAKEKVNKAIANLRAGRERGLPCVPQRELSPECQEDGHGKLPIFLELKQDGGERCVLDHWLGDAEEAEEAWLAQLETQRQLGGG